MNSSNVVVNFDLGTILSIVTPVLLTEMGNVYEILDYMTGDSNFTHQLPRVAAEMRPVILEQHPQLAEVNAEGIGTENWKEFLRDMVSKYGESLPIVPCGLWQHRTIDPQEEMLEMLNGDESKLVMVTSDIVENPEEMNKLVNHLKKIRE